MNTDTDTDTDTNLILDSIIRIQNEIYIIKFYL
jgi:hypothetical protein